MLVGTKNVSNQQKNLQPNKKIYGKKFRILVEISEEKNLWPKKKKKKIRPKIFFA